MILIAHIGGDERLAIAGGITPGYVLASNGARDRRLPALMGVLALRATAPEHLARLDGCGWSHCAGQLISAWARSPAGLAAQLSGGRIACGLPSMAAGDRLDLVAPTKCWLADAQMRMPLDRLGLSHMQRMPQRSPFRER
jgi:hypothetical protein